MIESIDVIEKNLSDIIDILVDTNADNWIDDLSRCKRSLPVNPNETIVNILSMYGAAGSLNDVVLYKNGHLLLKENSDLDELRSGLYDYCKALADQV